ncbi:MAG: UDP-N-acetylmuramate dehydrogenase, partial [Firmicutes bacterium]|nr:UDP-N-acetylmuramate dehydrogenase [Bacillota bacterium]
MNAGAYGGELGRLVETVTAYYPGEGEKTWRREELAFGYRTSRFQRERAIVEDVRLRLIPGDPALIRAEMEDYARRRQEKQPLQYPSAGSVFRRPPGAYAGTLIEDAGLKGFRVGGAQVSELHANFIVNLGGATAADVLALIELVRARVRERTGILLEPEIEIIGVD